MENLKSGDAPALVSNFEVMKILSKRLQSRVQHNEEDKQQKQRNERRNSSKHPKLRHRDYIEQSVYDYIQQSPCGNLKDVEFSTMTQLVKKLRGSRSNRDKRKGQSQTSQEQSQIIVDSKRPRNASVKNEEVSHLKQESSHEMEVLADNGNDNDNYGLTDAETIQILNHLPTLPVEIHLMIEDLTGRLSDDQQTSLLQLISDNSGR